MKLLLACFLYARVLSFTLPNNSPSLKSATASKLERTSQNCYYRNGPQCVRPTDTSIDGTKSAGGLVPSLLPKDDDDYIRSITVLTSVPVAWGTFEVAVRYAYTTEPSVPPYLFSIAYYTVAAVVLGTLAIATSVGQEEEEEPRSPTPPSLFLLLGAFELGFYLFVGNLLQVIGLQTVPSDRAAFLLQLTTLFVPLTQAFVDKKPIRKTVWVACSLALLGVGVMSFDTSDLAAVPQGRMTWGTGDSFIVLAAVSYTFHCLRLEGIAQRTSAIQLGAAKALAETVYSVLITVLIVSLATTKTNSNDDASYWISAGQECVSFASWLSTAVQDDWALLAPLGGAVLWTGLVPVAYTITAQSYGQARVRPVTANFIYTLQPIFTALFAFLLLHEQLGLVGYAGASLIGCAVLLVVSSSQPNEMDAM